MKLRIFLGLSYGLLFINLAGCAVLNKPVEFVDRFIGSTLFPPYSGPKASVVVADFEVKAVKATAEAGIGLHDMLVAALVKTNRFQIAALHKDETKNEAKLIIAAEVLDFEPRAAGGRLGVGGGGSAANGTLGSLLGTDLNKSYIAMNIRIVDAASSKVLASERIIGQATDTGSVSHKNSSLNEGLSAYAHTPMEQAIHKCIIDAVRYIVEEVPANYYKGGKIGKA